ncbi:MAG: hypothetical protein K6L75_14030 [Cellvibrionaceae bacterium]
MKHNQILDKLASGALIESLNEEISRLVFSAMAWEKNGGVNNRFEYVYSKLSVRWNCLINHYDLNSNVIHRFNVALVTILHKYGLEEKSLTKKAIESIKILNKEAVLSDSFFHKENEIIKFLSTQPKELTRCPAYIKSNTYYRAGDVISFEYKGSYVAAYIHADTGVNEAPIIEFYDLVFQTIPTINELTGVKSYGECFSKSENPTLKYAVKYAVYGLKYLPDLSRQVQLIASCINSKPDNSDLEEPISLYTSSNLADIQRTLENIVSTHKR